MANGFTNGAREATSQAIKPVRDVVDEHVRVTLESRGAMPEYLVAFHLGISPVTLMRMKKRWQSGEDPIKDRR